MWIGVNEKDFSIINLDKVEHITLDYDGKDYAIVFHMEKRILRWRYSNQKNRDDALMEIKNAANIKFIILEY
jgi:hypothetical protein